MPDEYILRIDCPDETGLVHKITGVLYHNQLNIIRNDEFVDRENGQFFMRTVFSGNTNPDKIMYGLKGILPTTAQIYLTARQVKSVVILVTKEHHCLSDLLIRHAFGELPMNIRAVIGNHQVLQSLTRQFGVPFHYISHEGISRETHEEQLAQVIQTFSQKYQRCRLLLYSKKQQAWLGKLRLFPCFKWPENKFAGTSTRRQAGICGGYFQKL
jgi:formyltetrahydrofolate deformylase